jgi:hypothetical protein
MHVGTERPSPLFLIAEIGPPGCVRCLSVSGVCNMHSLTETCWTMRSLLKVPRYMYLHPSSPAHVRTSHAHVSSIITDCQCKWCVTLRPLQ